MGVFVATCAVEVLQLWKAPFLEAMRATLLGRLILGNTFNWVDFPAYILGSSVGFGWTVFLNRFYIIYNDQTLAELHHAQ